MSFGVTIVLQIPVTIELALPVNDTHYSYFCDEGFTGPYCDTY